MTLPENRPSQSSILSLVAGRDTLKAVDQHVLGKELQGLPPARRAAPQNLPPKHLTITSFDMIKQHH